MSKYNFVDITAKASTTGYINSESPKMLTFGDEYLENLVDGFSIISVVGREILPQTILANKNEYLDGQTYFGSKVEPRELEFTYQIKANNPSELMSRYKKLNYYLTEKIELMFSFQDESLYYRGVVTAVGEIPAGTLKHISTFTITCSDPYKYSASKQVSGTGTLNINRDPVSKSTVIDSIKINVVNVATVDFDIVGSNNSYKTDNKQDYNFKYSIVFNKDKIKAGDTIILDYIKSICYLNGVENSSILHWSSDFDVLSVYSDYVINISSNNLEVNYRNRFI